MEPLQGKVIVYFHTRSSLLLDLLDFGTYCMGTVGIQVHWVTVSTHGSFFARLRYVTYHDNNRLSQLNNMLQMQMENMYVALY